MTVRLNLALTKENDKWLRIFAAEQGYSVTKVVNKIIRQFFIEAGCTPDLMKSEEVQLLTEILREIKSMKKPPVAAGGLRHKP